MDTVVDESGNNHEDEMDMLPPSPPRYHQIQPSPLQPAPLLVPAPIPAPAPAPAPAPPVLHRPLPSWRQFSQHAEQRQREPRRHSCTSAGSGTYAAAATAASGGMAKLDEALPGAIPEAIPGSIPEVRPGPMPGASIPEDMRDGMPSGVIYGNNSYINCQPHSTNTFSYNNYQYY